ncbi:WecB/TagA/CpsF family glycosyltransferase [Burkholderia sp. MS455]|uniref:N-acetylglucosaminyldiphosphoundecaprenol N-acetyl-beta-D-mannosaminyltransferase n=1 Tax=Burkholderia pyrrocinia TaxID=60550 RepID=A0A318IRR1_BURPY|nr:MULTISPECIES: WecB/TagA/CpsF family glycosyltransferase [Burkholderia]PXX38179.1 N-acetylglucosaminyldiphosphoundecaprenol N-acetyl-beta-D-mannosaminyltransferase [Burkholderia pyrrocinia]QRR05983.1 WecB/TagA/CpsF family glycosyltransferase [Burkholderia sp. MS455]SFW53607.1 N-acetylglucosaminyldiphosphoundecaprenol N-acetyl-beta-D-mannosaminyltransferase [Burkholderia sp. NFACC33-1]SFX57698.1 N-acetylglucosaminyldiphosphoundecaprenol N-acetyl-beta-D-mannosaminyltransferase [Burkholderia sp.
MNRIELFGCPMDVGTMTQTVELIRDRIARSQFTQHVVVNVAKLVNMQADPELAASVHACDIVNIDGMGVVWGARLLGHDVSERVAGVDLFERLLDMAQQDGLPVFMLGGSEVVVQKAACAVSAKYPMLRIAGIHHGYFWDDERTVVDQICASGAKLLFVAITSPRKENFINRWKSQLGVDFVMGVGGTFDVVAGKVKRAPLWMQRSGLEWAFRVIQEPGRMWKRYLSTNSRFLVMLTGAYVSRLFRRKGEVDAH